MSAYSTEVADSIAPAGFNAFSWKREEPSEARTPEQINADAHRNDMRNRMNARRTQEKATRVNPESHSGLSSGMALHRKEIRQELARAA